MHLLKLPLLFLEESYSGHTGRLPKIKREPNSDCQQYPKHVQHLETLGHTPVTISWLCGTSHPELPGLSREGPAVPKVQALRGKKSVMVQ